MKTIYKTLTTKALFILILGFCMLCGTPAQSQITFPDDVDDQAPAAPIDGFLGFGLLAGAFYGYRKLRDNR